MDARRAADRFSDLFHSVFLRFHGRCSGKKRELSQEAIGVLEHLSRTGPLTVTEAAKHFERSQSTTSEIIARLERRGLLTRIPDERDRRRSLVWMTDHGLSEWRRLQRVLSTEALTGAFEAMSVAQRRTILVALETLLGAAPPDPVTTRVP